MRSYIITQSHDHKCLYKTKRPFKIRLAVFYSGDIANLPLVWVYRRTIAANDEPILTPPTVIYRRRILVGGVCGTMMKNRNELRNSGRETHAYAMNIVANSVYGLLAFPSYPGYSPMCASAVTCVGRWLLHVMYVHGGQDGAEIRCGVWGHRQRVLLGDDTSGCEQTRV